MNIAIVAIASTAIFYFASGCSEAKSAKEPAPVPNAAGTPGPSASNDKSHPSDTADSRDPTRSELRKDLLWEPSAGVPEEAEESDPEDYDEDIIHEEIDHAEPDDESSDDFELDEGLDG